MRLFQQSMDRPQQHGFTCEQPRNKNQQHNGRVQQLPGPQLPVPHEYLAFSSQVSTRREPFFHSACSVKWWSRYPPSKNKIQAADTDDHAKNTGQERRRWNYILLEANFKSIPPYQVIEMFDIEFQSICDKNNTAMENLTRQFKGNYLNWDLRGQNLSNMKNLK